MEVVSLRPKLLSFRATAFHGENKAASSGDAPWNFELTQTIELGLGSAQDVPAPLQAVVKIDLAAKASKADAAEQTAQFNASYEAKFEYPVATQESAVQPLFAEEPYQYLLVAQVFPLAMTHFRRELQSLGFDARHMPLGM